jgi:hypothetical protein
MLRLIILSSFVILLGGLCAVNMPAEAQQLFIKKSSDSDKDAEKTGKTKLFVTPKGYTSKSKKESSVKYSDKLNLVQEIKFNKEQIKSYEYWQKSGRQPETMEERVAYAQAKHSVEYAVMLERKAQLIPALEKKLRNQPAPTGYEGSASDSAKSYQEAAVKLQKSFDKFGFEIDIPKSEEAMASAKANVTGAFVTQEKGSDTVGSDWKKSGGTMQKSVKVKKTSVFNSGT